MRRGKIVFALLLPALFVIGGLLVFRSSAPSGIEAHEREFQAARALVFGRELAKRIPGGKLLVITGWDAEGEVLAKEQLSELKKGLGGSFTLLGEERLEVERSRRGRRYVPASKISIKDFEVLLGKHPEATLVVSMIGLPRNFEKMTLWKKPQSERPLIALLDCELRPLGKALRAGYLSAVTCQRPGWACTGELPSDPQEAFELRYLLVTPENVDVLAKRYEGLINE